MIRSPTFSPAAETTTPPRTSGSAAPRPSPPGPTSPASPWLHNHAYRRASLSPSRFPSICRSQVDGAPGSDPDPIDPHPAPGGWLKPSRKSSISASFITLAASAQEKGRGNPALPVQQGSLGLAVPTTPEAAAMEAASEAATAMETTTDAVPEAATGEM